MLQLLDLAGIYFRAFFAVPASMTSPDGRPVNAVRGTLDIIRRVVADGRPTRVIACLDLDWRPAFRVELIPSYKTHRVVEEIVPAPGDPFVEVIPDDLSPQIPILLEVLAAMGVTIAGAEGFEADDVIATLVEAETVDPVEVVTGDRDLFQLARDVPTRTVVRYIGAGMSKMQLLDATGVAEKHGIPAGSYPDFAALRGDPSDGLPGVAGVGDKTAAALVRRYGTVEGLLIAADDPKSAFGAGQRAKILAARDYLAVAPQVVRAARHAPVEVSPAGNGALPVSAEDPEELEKLVRANGIGASVQRLQEAIAEAAAR